MDMRKELFGIICNACAAVLSFWVAVISDNVLSFIAGVFFLIAAISGLIKHNKVE